MLNYGLSCIRDLGFAAGAAYDLSVTHSRAKSVSMGAQAGSCTTMSMGVVSDGGIMIHVSNTGTLRLALGWLQDQL